MSLAWTIFTIVFLVGFGVLEFIGWRRLKTRGTWSYWWWRVLFRDHLRALNGQRPKKVRGVIWFILGGTLLWVVIHILTGGVV